MPRHPKKSERRADVPADKTELPLWIVCAIRGAWAEGIATVRAKDAVGAVAAVVKQQAITDPEYIKRLAARPG